MAKYGLRNRFVEKAESYLGCNEFDGSFRPIIDLYNSHAPLARGYKMSYSDEWCCTFVSAVSIACEATDIIPTECGCERQIILFKELGRWNEDGSIVPSKGDICYYNWQDNTQPNDGTSNHVGIVQKVQDGRVYVIEGNYSASVKIRDFEVGWGCVRGYAQPNFGSEGPSAGLSEEDLSFFDGLSENTPSNRKGGGEATGANFDRQYRLAVGPAGGSGFEIGATSAAQPVPLRVNFSFQKSDLETQNTGKVTVWNLNKEHRAALDEKDCCVSLKAGYGSRMSLIFAGIVSYVETNYDGADRKTDIEVIDNLVQIRDTYVSVSYNGTVNWKTIFDDVADQMGVAIVYSYNAEFKDITNGFSYIGLAKNIMTKGCDCCGLSWSLQNGVMHVKKKGDTMSREVFVLSPDSGLLGFPKRVVLTEDEATGGNTIGWDVDYFLNGAINIDDYVKVESSLITGYFRVQSVQIDGDTVSGDWICTARLLEVTE